jgi:hypothetical protein
METCAGGVATAGAFSGKPDALMSQHSNPWYWLGAFAGWTLLLIYVGIAISDWTDVVIRAATHP